MYEILIFTKYISHKKEIKVNNLAPVYDQNLIYPLVVLKLDPIEPKLFLKSQNLHKILSKCISYCKVYFCALDNIQKQFFFFVSLFAYIANTLEFFFNLDVHNWGEGVIKCNQTCL